MKVKRIIAIALAMLVMTWGVSLYANAQPALPHAFYGALEVNGSDAEPGYTVEARGEGVTTGIAGNPIETTEVGRYGSVDPLGAKLTVQGDISDGATITFWVNGRQARILSIDGEPADPETKEYGWHSGWITRVDLSVTITAPPAGGPGGGGPAPDTTPPSISNVVSCYEGITETTADICWITNEPGTSQVEYWASPGMLSPLDETLVTDHHVNLTGLTPATTYHYKTMSKDAAGNLAISPEYTFTTLEKEKPLVPEPAPPTPTPPAPAPPAPPPAPPPVTPPEVAAPINWPVVGGIIAGVVVVGLLIFFLVRRKAY